MPFPQSPLPVVGEILIDGAWVNVTSRVRGSDDITITRGTANEQGEASPVTCDFTLNNRDGLFSNRNPLSTYYGKIGRNTPVRFGVTDTMAMRCPPYHLTASNVQTTDKAALDIVGDLEIRVDVEPYSWRPTRGLTFAGKTTTTANQRSWALGLDIDGTIYFTWSPNGTFASSIGLYSTVGVPAVQGRKSIKVTLDVDNGSGGWTVRFYTSDSINGTYTQLGAGYSTSSGITSVYASTAPLTVGSGADGIVQIAYFESFGGKFHNFQLRSGIGGSIVAQTDFTAQTEGATSFADGLGNTWATGGLARISARDHRFHGEMSALPQVWDNTGTDVFVPVQAAGVKRRLTQGDPPAFSPTYRALDAMTLWGWWPGEDGSDSTRVASALPGSRAARLVDVSLGTVDETLPTAASVMTFNSSSSYLSGSAKDSRTNTGYAQFFFYFKFPTIPATEVELFSVYFTGGTIYKAMISVTATTYKVTYVNSDGTVLATTSTLHGSTGTPDKWTAMWLDSFQSGGNVSYNLSWYGTDAQEFYNFSPLTFVGTVGRIRSFIVWDRTGRDGQRLSHIVVTQSNTDFYSADFSAAANAYQQERAAERIARLFGEEGVTFYGRGNPSDSEVMGAQTAKTVYALAQEAAELDGGILSEARDFLGVTYRTRLDLHNQWPLTLSYSSDHLWRELRPIEDDQNLRNVVTVSRPNGSSAVAKQTTGPLSVNAPTATPPGVGPYKSEVSRNTYTDDRLDSLAQYEVALGTVDELRYPSVDVNLARAPFIASTYLSAAVAAMELGDELALSGLPVWLPPGPVELLLRGVVERISNNDRERAWAFTFRCSPYAPYRVNNLTSYDTSVYRAGASSSTMSAGVNAAALSLSVATSSGPLWGTTAAKPGNFPLDIMVSGERMTVSGIAGTTSPQTFTISARAVNGVSKAIPAGAAVDVVGSFNATL